MKTVAITGSEGFVGRHLVQCFAKAGYRVIAYSRHGKTVTKRDEVIARAWDLTKPYDESADSSDIFIHNAALASFDASYEQAYSVNVDGTKHAYELALRSGCRLFIYISSASVYSRHIRKKQLSEDARCVDIDDRQENTYARTKRAAELWLLSQSDSMQIVILRPHAIYGAGDTTLIPQIKQRAKAGRLFLPLQASTEISLTYVDTLADICGFVADKRKILRYAIYNVGDGHSMATVDVFRVIARKLHLQIIIVPISIALLYARISELIARIIGKSPAIHRNVVHQVSRDSSISSKRLEGEGYLVPGNLARASRVYLENFDI